jgi:mono/diheme cytochrome c family protein
MDPVTRRLTGRHMSDAPSQFGPIYSKNITRDRTKGIGAWTDGELAVLLRTGLSRDGRYVPPPMPKLSHLADEDLYSIIAFFKSDDPLVAPVAVDAPGVSKPSLLMKALANIAFKPLPYPQTPLVAPSAADPIARGRYLATTLECYGCHSASFLTMDIEDPEKSRGYMGGGNTLTDLRGQPIQSPNLTPDMATGIGRWSQADFVRALKKGLRPDNKPIRYPMVPLVELEDAEAAAIHSYLRTIPAISNSVGRVENAADGTNAGRRIYYKYGCVSCHGDNGIGIADLRGSREHYPSDRELEQWIRHAPAIKPGTKMPGWNAVIEEDEYAPLIQYVRQLGG